MWSTPYQIYERVHVTIDILIYHDNNECRDQNKEKSRPSWHSIKSTRSHGRLNSWPSSSIRTLGSFCSLDWDPSQASALSQNDPRIRCCWSWEQECPGIRSHLLSGRKFKVPEMWNQDKSKIQKLKMEEKDLCFCDHGHYSSCWVQVFSPFAETFEARIYRICFVFNFRKVIGYECHVITAPAGPGAAARGQTHIFVAKCNAPINWNKNHT